MRIEIEIPKEFEEHFMQDKFKDSLERIMADIKHSLDNQGCLCSGRYEYETIEMLERAFEGSQPAYPVKKVVDELDKIYWNTIDDRNKAIEVVKAGGENE